MGILGVGSKPFSFVPALSFLCSEKQALSRNIYQCPYLPPHLKLPTYCDNSFEIIEWWQLHKQMVL